MAVTERNIRIDPESTSTELVLEVEKGTSETSIQHYTDISRAVCVLLNSRKGKVKVKAHTENQDCNFTKHGIPNDLDMSLKAIQPLVQNYLDFNQEDPYFFIFVKSFSLDMSGVQPATIATNLYMRNGASSIPMDLYAALQFFKEMEHTGRRLPLKTNLLDKKPGEDVKDEVNVQELAASFFDQTTVIEMSKFDFSESKNVEYKSFGTHKLIQRVKEILPRTVSAFANTDGGYLFIGLCEKNRQVIGFKVEESKPVEAEESKPVEAEESKPVKAEDSEFMKELQGKIDKCIEQLPVVHFCEEKQQIKYTCKFIKVHRSGDGCSYVFALRVERFCCVVFAAEPDSWYMEDSCEKRHVEDNCVERFTSDQWVKLQMDAIPGCGTGINNHFIFGSGGWTIDV